MANLYAVTAETRVGHPNATNFRNTPTVHVSASTAEIAAREGQRRARRWAEKEHRYFFDNDTPTSAVVIKVECIDEGWDL